MINILPQSLRNNKNTDEQCAHVIKLRNATLDCLCTITGRPKLMMDHVMPTIVVESGSPSDSVASNGDDAKNGAHCNGDLLGPSAALSPEHADTGEDSDTEEVSEAILA